MAKKSRKKIGAAIAITLVALFALVYLPSGIIFDSKNILMEQLQMTSDTAEKTVTDASQVIIRTIDEQLDKAKMQLDPITTTIQQSSLPKVSEQPPVFENDLEPLIHDLINEQRTIHGLDKLVWDNKLAQVARTHSLDMADRGFFSHVNPDGADPTDRGKALGYSCRKVVGNLIYTGIAENIFQNNLYSRVWQVNGVPTSYEWNTQEEIATTTVDGWMNSTGHRKNILTETFDRQGVGVIISDDDKVYITQNLC